MNGTRSREGVRIEDALGRMYEDDVARARYDLAVEPLQPRTGSRLDISIGSVVGVVLVIGLLVILGPRPSPTTNGGGTGSASTTAESASSAPSATNRTGLPVSVQDQSVLTSDEAQALIIRSNEAVELLVGGWLHEAAATSCPVGADPWQPCRALPLYGARSGGRAIFVYGVDRISPIDLPPAGSVKGLVLRVHTHDEACDKQGCEALPVAETIVWTGELEPASYVEPAQPAAGIDASDASAAARTLLPECESWNQVATSAGAFADLAPVGDIAGDRWVWAITFESASAATDTGGSSATELCPPGAQRAVVYVDYISGMPLEADIASVAGPTPSE